eukprot:3103105-Rhodomonas_salina.2
MRQDLQRPKTKLGVHDDLSASKETKTQHDLSGGDVRRRRPCRRGCPFRSRGSVRRGGQGRRAQRWSPARARTAPPPSRPARETEGSLEGSDAVRPARRLSRAKPDAARNAREKKKPRQPQYKSTKKRGRGY